MTNALDTRLTDTRRTDPSEAAPDGLSADALSPDAPNADTLNADEPGEDAGPWAIPLERILRLVRARLGHDFTRYKRATLVRRIERRMRGQHLHDASVYLRRLEESPAEVEALFQDFTINVTSFFRGVEAFESLKNHLREAIRAHKQPHDTFRGSTFRVWVTACSTGEEAYSVAIVLSELIGELSAELSGEQTLQVQIFATDIDQVAVDVARQGRYSTDISYVVSAERLHRYFVLRDGQYQVRAEIRNLVVFATHSTFGDPPFTRLDLLCCRNMLIYIGTELQQQLLETFVYALRPAGLLFLGASETVGQQRDRFTVLDARWKIFRRGAGHIRLPQFGATFRAGGSGQPAANRPPLLASTGTYTTGTGSDLAQQVQRTLLAEHAPPAVVVSGEGEVLYVHGRTARYLELPTGHLPHTIFQLVPQVLRHRLQAAVREVSSERRERVLQGVRLESGGQWQTLDVSVRPLRAAQSGPLLITFLERPEPAVAGAAALAGAAGGEAPEAGNSTAHQASEHQASGNHEQVAALEQELSSLRETLQATVDEMAISVEELRSSNEELTTSKEELQSLNEELHTIDAEHRLIIQDQAEANDDIRNLLDNAGTATVFLNLDLSIRRFTLPISNIIPLTAADQGRPLADFNVRLRYSHLLPDLRRVLETLEPLEAQVQTQAGEWYLMRISPYRTHDNRIGGVVLAFTNIEVVKSLEWRLVQSLHQAESEMDNLQDPLLLLEQHLRAVTASRVLLGLLNSITLTIDGERPVGSSTDGLDVPGLERRLREVVAAEEPLASSLLELNVSQQQARRLRVEAEVLISEAGKSHVVQLDLGDRPGLKPAAKEVTDNAVTDTTAEAQAAPTPSADET